MSTCCASEPGRPETPRGGRTASVDLDLVAATQRAIVAIRSNAWGSSVTHVNIAVLAIAVIQKRIRNARLIDLWRRRCCATTAPRPAADDAEREQGGFRDALAAVDGGRLVDRVEREAQPTGADVEEVDPGRHPAGDGGQRVEQAERHERETAGRAPSRRWRRRGTAAQGRPGRVWHGPQYTGRPSEPYPLERRMDIRPYLDTDEAAVIALWEACGLTRAWNDPRKDIARKLAVQRDWFLVGTADGRVVASVMAGYDGHRGWINYLAVSPDDRMHGRGRLLMAEAERLLLAVGCPKINLQIRSSNAAVIEFYRRLGYVQDDVVSMGRRLIPDEPRG